jgi:hypothetical protein
MLLINYYLIKISSTLLDLEISKDVYWPLIEINLICFIIIIIIIYLTAIGL